MQVVVEDYVPYEDNVRWKVHNAYFAQSGLRPWTSKLIPQETTNGPITALQHARLLVSLADQLREGDLWMLEIGGGAGGFVVNLYDALNHDCGAAGRDVAKRLKYVLTDYQRRTVEEAAELPALQPLIESGALTVAQLDVREAFAVRALDGSLVEREWSVVIANYIVCATPVRWIQKKGGRYFRCFVQTWADLEMSDLIAPEALVQSFLDEATADGLLDQLTYTVDWRPESLEALGGDALGASIIERTLAHVEEGTLGYPFVFMRFLTEALERVRPGGLVLVNDLGRSDPWELSGLNMPVYRHYGNTVNHPIHTRLYEAYSEVRGLGFVGGNDTLAPLQQVVIAKAEAVYEPVRRVFIEDVVLRSDMADFLDFAEAAQISSQRGDSDRAIRLLRRCLPFERRTARLRYQLAETCAQHGYARMAREYVRQGLEMPDAGDYDFDFILGRVYADLGDRDAAIEAFEASIQRGPHEVTWANLGELHAEAGDLEKAYECWRRTLDLDPKHERARQRLDWLRDSFWTARRAELDERFGLEPLSLPEAEDDEE